MTSRFLLTNLKRITVDKAGDNLVPTLCVGMQSWPLCGRESAWLVTR
jgi:hypothetical protein